MVAGVTSPRVVPVRIVVWDDELRADVLRVVGYRAECSCGWRGRHRRRRVVAAADLHEHKSSQHGHRV